MKNFVSFYVFILVILLNGFVLRCYAQEGGSMYGNPDSVINARLIPVAIGGGVLYGVTMYGLYEYWYKDYDKTSFHFFNDNKEWQQMDKMGHLWTSYVVSNISKEIFSWTGIKRDKATWLGAGVSLTFLTSIEILDGFSEKWGASPGDIGFNILGTGLMVGQEFLWKQQKLRLKVSGSSKEYTGSLEQRGRDLFGVSWAERTLKDYNAQTYWLVLDITPFQEGKKFLPHWLNIAVGYGAEGMLGGFDNVYIQDGQVIDRSDITRYRQYYLSLDVDLSAIKTNSKILKPILNTLNFFKQPLPTLEYNKEQGFIFHFFFF